MSMVRVAKMPQTMEYNGKKYGPSAGPITVPLELAVALGLQRIEGGEVVPASRDEQGQELAASRNLAGQFQRNLDLLVDQLRPHIKTDLGETPDQTLERLLVEREKALGASAKVEDLEGIIRQGKADNERLIREAGDSRQEVQRLTTELQSAKANLENTQKGYDDYRAEMEGKVDTLTKERDDARQALADAKLLPDDALERLEGVSGISKALAQKGLDALLAPAEGASK
ncbi:MAG: hypothetical protein Q4C89_00915 [Deinococcus sp.]|uniref:hypothetical protein n=1 Tax=Deinococcus sp. TaxID=47478 RepID=UPI0026DAE61F|nr:hypothetical protein [Deinococcus sp.]MDO4244570.1 hypothetical protein [Deinococcus sp.]